MRHGEATPMQADDAARQLTQKGHIEAEKMGLWLAKNYAPDALLVSPYIRAQQQQKGLLKITRLNLAKPAKTLYLKVNRKLQPITSRR